MEINVPEPSEIERENLEAHVEICAYRYNALEKRLSNIEEKVAEIHQKITSNNQDLSKVIVGAAGSVLAGLLGLIATIALTFHK